MGEQKVQSKLYRQDRRAARARRERRLWTTWHRWRTLAELRREAPHGHAA